MTFRNENKVPFIDCTPDQQLEIIQAKKTNICERLLKFTSGEWIQSNNKEIALNGIYRVEERKTVKTDAGMAIRKEVWKWELTDISQVPKEFTQTVVNKLIIDAAVKSGNRSIPGILIYPEIQTTYRRA